MKKRNGFTAKELYEKIFSLFPGEGHKRVAELLGVHQSTPGKWKTGDYFPQEDVLDRVAELKGLPLNWWRSDPKPPEHHDEFIEEAARIMKQLSPMGKIVACQQIYQVLIEEKLAKLRPTGRPMSPEEQKHERELRGALRRSVEPAELVPGEAEAPPFAVRFRGDSQGEEAQSPEQSGDLVRTSQGRDKGA